MTTSGIPLGVSLSPAEKQFWRQAQREVLWGWKRDVGAHSRLVYFSAQLSLDGRSVSVKNPYFFYKHRVAQADVDSLTTDLEKASIELASVVSRTALDVSRSRDGTSTIRFEFGVPRPADADRTRRLQLRRPRRRIQPASIPEPAPEASIHEVWPCDLYVGSGVSYEAGLPTLCDMHAHFCVDTPDGHAFTSGASDRLPGRLASDPIAALADFCCVHTKALTAEPTRAHGIIKRFVAEGRVGRVFTDNVDNLLAKLDVPFVRTRGSGVFNERFPVDFASDILVVIGVAADRREVVRQARARRLDVVVVNPCLRVAPHVQHLNYVRPGDRFYRITADRFFSVSARTAR